MKTAIIDADLIGRDKHRFPNLVCMKLSGYYKELGAEVELKMDYEDLAAYDKVFISKVFTDTPIDEEILKLPNVEYGGTGFFYDKAPKLPDEVEHHIPDYHLYDEWVNGRLNEGGKRKDFTYYLDYSIGFTCYDDCTEILTDEGWKLFKDLNRNEKVMTLNPETNEIEWKRPYEYIENAYDGDMHIYKNKYIDLMVTPNHNMYVNKYKQFELIQSDIIRKYYKYKFKKDGKWDGKEEQWFHFDDTDKITSSKILDKIPMDTFLEFLGYYLSEGSTQFKEKTNSYIVRIAQKRNGFHNAEKGDTYKKIENCIKRMGYNYYANENDGISISNKQLYTYCKQFGLQPDRFVPDFIKQLSIRQIRIFIDAYVLGDGGIYKSKNKKTISIISSSKKIMDDFQELFLKIGGCGDIHCYTKKGDITKYGDREIICKHNIYTIFLNNHCKTPMFSKQNTKVRIERYNGKIYCVEVENHIIYVRRNGVACWSGNTRGCIRQCSFCVNKNYKSCEVHSHLSEFMDESRAYICLLDDNVLACKDWRSIFEELIATGKKFQFKQGCDERLLTDEKCEILFKKSKWIRDRIFAFDNIKDREVIERKLQMIRRHTNDQIKFYTFCGYNHDNIGIYDEEFWVKDIEDLFERIKILMTYGCLPYVMRFKDYVLSPYKGIYINAASWCNQPSLFRKMSFAEYSMARGMSNENYKKYKMDFDSYLANGNKKGSSWKYYEEFASKYPEIAEKYFHMKWNYSNRNK